MNIVKNLFFAKEDGHIYNIGFLEITWPAFVKHKIIKMNNISTLFACLILFIYQILSLKISLSLLHRWHQESFLAIPEIVLCGYVPWGRNKYNLESLQHNPPHILNKYQGIKSSSPKELGMHFENMWGSSLFFYAFHCHLSEPIVLLSCNPCVYLFLLEYRISFFYFSHALVHSCK